MKINIPETGQKRIVVIGGGFAGLELVKKLSKLDVQVVMVDKNNYHQFQPLFYQVATAGLEPSSIAFPLRKIIRKYKNVHFRTCEVEEIFPKEGYVQTNYGRLNFDHLVIATGADTNFYGNENLQKHAIPMKSVSEALYLRNQIFADFEYALTRPDYDDRQPFMDIVIVGGGPTGVELAGALAEMKKFIVPKDYQELDAGEVDIHLVQSGDKILKGFSEASSSESLAFLKKLGVDVILGDRVVDYDGCDVHLQSGKKLRAHKVIWAAGIKANSLKGLEETTYGNRYAVNRFSQIDGFENIFAIGDCAYMETPNFPQGHPQVAQVALQQGRNLAKNFKNQLKGKSEQAFTYDDKGSMATIGRNLAVVDLPKTHFKGFFAWMMWLVVHLLAIIGAKNKLFIFLNWVWNYITYDQSLRLIIRPFKREK